MEEQLCSIFTSRWQPQTTSQQNSAKRSRGTLRFFTGSPSESRHSTTALHPTWSHLLHYHFCFLFSCFPPIGKQNITRASKELPWFLSKTGLLLSEVVLHVCARCVYICLHIRSSLPVICIFPGLATKWKQLCTELSRGEGEVWAQPIRDLATHRIVHSGPGVPNDGHGSILEHTLFWWWPGLFDASWTPASRTSKSYANTQWPQR